MKKLLLLATFLVAVSCGNNKEIIPLVEGPDGKLIEDPNYVTKEMKEQAKKNADVAYKDVGSNMKKWADSAVQADKENPNLSIDERKNFAKTFKSKTGPNKISISGKKKTIITFTGAFNTETTYEQFERLNYFTEMRSLGFKKVIISNGVKVMSEKDL